MKKYLWCEDTGAGYEFWDKIFKHIDVNIIVETKKNNSELRKSVEDITDEDNIYYVLIDNAVDNPDVLREIKRVNRIVSEKYNVKLIKVHSFESVLLSFDFLEQWIFAKNDVLRAKRKGLIAAKDIFVKLIKDSGDAEELRLLKESLGVSTNKNSEQIASKLLWEITRNTGFETDKGHLGTCFIVTCCDWKERGDEDICGLDEERLSGDDKKSLLIEHTIINKSLKEAGII